MCVCGWVRFFVHIYWGWSPRIHATREYKRRRYFFIWISPNTRTLTPQMKWTKPSERKQNQATDRPPHSAGKWRDDDEDDDTIGDDEDIDDERRYTHAGTPAPPHKREHIYIHWWAKNKMIIFIASSHTHTTWNIWQNKNHNNHMRLFNKNPNTRKKQQ